MVGRIPILDVTPQIEGGKYAAKAAVGEPFEVSAVVIREGHDALNAEVVLVDPEGRRRAPQAMSRTPDDVDRWRVTVVADTVGAWGFEVHGWSDPLATWRHHAEVKVPAGVDTELVFTEGALLLDRVAKTLAATKSTDENDAKVLTDAAAVLRDTSRPDAVRLA